MTLSCVSFLSGFRKSYFKYEQDLNHEDFVSRALTENSPVSGSSLKKAEMFYEYFDIYSYPK